MNSVVKQGGGNASKVLHNSSKNCVRRYSGERYINPPEKIQQIKEKYKNGVTIDVINEMLGIVRCFMGKEGLSSVHLFSGWDLKDNPIKMRMTESLKFAAEMPDEPFSFRPSSETQCGTISVKLDQEQWDNVISTLKEQSDLLELRRYKAEELRKEINHYLERKCEEYCEKNNIDFIQWSQFAASRHKDSTWEVYYMGELVCGARLNFELVEGATETNINLELY